MIGAVGGVRVLADALGIPAPAVITPEFVRSVREGWAKLNAELQSAVAELETLRKSCEEAGIEEWSADHASSQHHA